MMRRREAYATLAANKKGSSNVTIELDRNESREKQLIFSCKAGLHLRIDSTGTANDRVIRELEAVPT